MLEIEKNNGNKGVKLKREENNTRIKNTEMRENEKC